MFDQVLIIDKMSIENSNYECEKTHTHQCPHSRPMGGPRCVRKHGDTYKPKERKRLQVDEGHMVAVTFSCILPLGLVNCGCSGKIVRMRK